MAIVEHTPKILTSSRIENRELLINYDGFKSQIIQNIFQFQAILRGAISLISEEDWEASNKLGSALAIMNYIDDGLDQFAFQTDNTFLTSD